MTQMTSADYVAYIKAAAAKINSERDYITALDAATGDGDHWANLNAGFSKLLEIADDLATMPVSDMLKKTGMTLMSAVGGSSGVLYGSGYIAAAKAMAGKDTMSAADIGEMLEAMLSAIMARGNAQPGQKTMIDALHPAVVAFKDALPDEAAAYSDMKAAALAGAQSTKDMEAVRGRACYQADKGMGHLDPGAVTMAYQLETLADCLIKNNTESLSMSDQSDI